MSKMKFSRLFFGCLSVVLVFSVCLFLRGLSGRNTPEDSIVGCYEFDECLYMSPLSSYLPPPKGFMSYVYGISNDSLIIINTENGRIEQFSAQHETKPISANELSTKAGFMPESFPYSDLSRYKERWLRATFKGAEQQYSLYQLDGEIWLVRINGQCLWNIYKLQKTDKTDLADLEYALSVQSDGLPQMTLQDVYELSHKGKDLMLRDLYRFNGKAVGSGFMIMRYEIEGGPVLIVHCDSPDRAPNYARLSKRGCNPFDQSLTVDIRDGAEAIAEYLNPLHSLIKLSIEDSHGGQEPRELIYEFGGYRYYLNTTRAERVYINFDNGDRLPLKQALEERRLIIEDAVANGLYNVSMEPCENTLGGRFTILHHLHRFTFDKELFYPSATFMYVVFEDTFTTYFDASELAEICELQGRSELAKKLRHIINTHNLPVIAGKAYITDNGLAEIGITVNVGWAVSSHTPVVFSSSGRYFTCKK